MIIAKRVWLNFCTLAIVGVALSLVEFFDMFLIPVLLILVQGIVLTLTRCRECGCFLIFRWYVMVVPWIPKTCPKCGKINPLDPDKHEK